MQTMNKVVDPAAKKVSHLHELLLALHVFPPFLLAPSGPIVIDTKSVTTSSLSCIAQLEHATLQCECRNHFIFIWSYAILGYCLRWWKVHVHNV